MTTRFRRGALLLIAAAIAAGPFAVTAAASAAGCPGSLYVDVHFPDDSRSQQVCLSGIPTDDYDVHGMDYPDNTPNGSAPTDPVSGISLHKLLAGELGVDPDSVTYTQANRRDGTLATLGPGDLGGSPAFENSLKPVVGVVGNDDAIQYVRPPRNDSDLNYRDYYQLSSGASLHLSVHTRGKLFTPTVSEDHGSGRLRAGHATTFTATLPDDVAASDVTSYEWTFQGGTEPVTGGPTIEHTYEDEGTYGASVTVTADDPDGGTDYGQSAVLPVQVGTPSKPAGNGPPGGGGNGSKHDPVTGPKHGHGHRQGEKPSGGPTAGNGSDNGPTGDGESAGSGPSDRGAGSGAATPSATPSVGPAGSAAPTGSRTTGPNPTADGFVDGILIEGAAPQRPARAQRSSDPAAASARRPARVTDDVDARWLWVLLPMALLAVGAFGERRWQLRPRRRRLALTGPGERS